MEQVIFVTVFTVSVGYFFMEIGKRYQYIRLGRGENRSDNPGTRWKYLFCQLLGHQKIREYPVSGLFHWPIAWGFVVLLFSSLHMALSYLFDFSLPLLTAPWFLWVRDLFLVLVLCGGLGFLLLRLFFKPDWLHNSFKAYGILVLILVIVFSEIIFLTAEAALISAPATGTGWLIATLAQATTVVQGSLLAVLEKVSFWVHFLSMFSFFYIIPHTKHLHMLFAPFNIYWRSLRPSGQLRISASDRDGARGVEVVEDFTWKQLLDAFSCVLCGRCHGACPSERSLERLKPKKINGRLRTYLEDAGRQLWREPLSKKAAGKDNRTGQQKSLKVVGDLFHDDFIWSCTTCGSCNWVCPVSIDHLGKIIDMRRNMVDKNKFIPPAVETVFSNLQETGNTLGVQPVKSGEINRFKPAKLPAGKEKPAAEYLLYLGCQILHNRQCRDTGFALAKLLDSAGVTYTTPGVHEICCGETVRRMGNEALFQQTARQNISVWQQLGVKKIITACPHCYNTLKNEYPEWGGNFQVFHYTSLLWALFKEGRFSVTGEYSRTVTYHDPCYLAKHNGILAAPRELLAAVPGIRLVEMPRTKKNAFCCGGGGGRFWLRGSEENPISRNRVDEILSSPGEVVVTACSYCNIIFREEIAKSHSGSPVAVEDLAQLLSRVV